jgi:hypothetical protein
MKIFLVNVGANVSHQSYAKSPLFADGGFVFVPFPHKKGKQERCPYPINARPFTRNLDLYQTHADPDWPNLTYGDTLSNGRASRLKEVEPGDILLFWALLWGNEGDDWSTFTKDQSWHLIGALRVEEMVPSGQSAATASKTNRTRVSKNVHFANGKLNDTDQVFIGDRNHSQLFSYAVPFVNPFSKRCLLYRTVRTADDYLLPEDKHWSGFVRACRPICDLETKDGLKRATLLRDAIAACNEFDLLE